MLQRPTSHDVKAKQHKQLESLTASQPASTSNSSQPSLSGTTDSSKQSYVTARRRRTSIPEKPNYSLNLWSIMRNSIGKELSKIPMPVRF